MSGKNTKLEEIKKQCEIALRGGSSSDYALNQIRKILNS
jgi:hypothetical protein